MTELADHLVKDNLQVILTQVIGTAHAEVEVEVFRQGRAHHPFFDQGLDQQVIGFVTELEARLFSLRMATADQFIADIDR